MEVAVIGGGIVGLSSAYYLGKADHSVTVYEKGRIGHGSTERSAGGIRRQFSTPVNVELSVESLSVWERFEEIFGEKIDFRRPGYLFFAREPETANQFERTVEMHHDHGVPTELLEPEEAMEYCPELRADQFVKATYLETDGYADPHLAVQGIAGSLSSVGVNLETHTAVTDIVTRNGSVSSIVVDGRRRSVDFVVNAAGPWARRVAQMAGIDLPVAPRRRQVLIVDPETSVPSSVPLAIDLDTGSYFRPERDGAALVGGHFETEDDPDVDPDGYSETVDLDYTITALERAGDFAGYFGPETEVMDGWAGLYAVTPDHHPILEETTPGLVTAAGFSGHGFQHAPATGKLVAELLTDGEASLVDIDVLGSERFEQGKLIEEQNVA